jgi:hypothetical protein
VLQQGRGTPAEFRLPADLEHFARGVVRRRGVKADSPGIADGRRDQAGEFGDRDVIAGAMLTKPLSE